MAAPGIRVRLVGAPGATPGPAVPYGGQRFQELWGRCRERGELFIDPLFDARPAALGYHNLGPYTPVAQEVQWRRPQVRPGPAGRGLEGLQGGGSPGSCMGQRGDWGCLGLYEPPRPGLGVLGAVQTTPGQDRGLYRPQQQSRRPGQVQGKEPCPSQQLHPWSVCSALNEVAGD